MSDHERSAAQRRATAAMEAESRAWMMQCPHCGFERSVWDAGGIRYKAAGSPRWYQRCASCGRRGWQKVHWAGTAPPGTPGGPASTGFIVKLVLFIVGGVLIGTAAIILGALWLAGVL
jgi:hypothetical protein